MQLYLFNLMLFKYILALIYFLGKNYFHFITKGNLIEIELRFVLFMSPRHLQGIKILFSLIYDFFIFVQKFMGAFGILKFFIVTNFNLKNR